MNKEKSWKDLYDSNQSTGNSQAKIELSISARNLINLDLVSKSDPQCICYMRTSTREEYEEIGRTEILKDDLNPDFSTKILVQYNFEVVQYLKFELWDIDLNENDFLGRVETTLPEIIANKNRQFIRPNKQIRNEKKKKTKGTLLLEYTKLANTYSFFDYVRTNLDIKFSVAIDFTSSNSNGPPNAPSSFHYIDPSGSKLNLYQIAIKSIGNIIQYYNSSHQFAGWGFGAIVPPDNKISHCFPLNKNPDSPFCESVEDLLSHYKKIIENVKLSGPTCFAPIIDCAANMAKNQEKNSYSVLLIITDGVLCDLPQTKRSIIRSSTLPISIIIVGIGSADFSSMIELDSDDGPLEQDGKKAVRDIVQFVELSKYINSESNIVDSDLENELAKEVLEEVPDQVVQYFEMQGIKPLVSN